MTRYVIGRVLAGLVTLFLFVTLLFFMARLLMPMRQEPGEDPSVWESYTEYLGHLADGDLLESGATGALPWTLLILVFAVGIGFPLGHWIGKTAGWRSGAAGAPGITIGAVLAYTVFPPLLVFALIMAVSRLTDDQGIGFLRILFNEGGLDPETAWSMLRTIALIWLGVGIAALLAARWHRTVPRLAWASVLVAGPFLLWAALGMWDEVYDILLYLGLPIIAVAVLVIGEVILVSKSTTAEAAHEDFVFTARAKGLSDHQVRDHHAARYALIPTLSKLVVSVPFVLVGLMIVELSFGWPKFGFDPAGGTGLGAFGMVVPGMSSTVFTALEFRDTTTVVDGLLVVGIVVLVMRLILEVLHAALDPRIRVGSRAQ